MAFYTAALLAITGHAPGAVICTALTLPLTEAAFLIGCADPLTRTRASSGVGLADLAAHTAHTKEHYENNESHRNNVPQSRGRCLLGLE